MTVARPAMGMPAVVVADCHRDPAAQEASEHDTRSAGCRHYAGGPLARLFPRARHRRTRHRRSRWNGRAGGRGRSRPGGRGVGGSGGLGSGGAQLLRCRNA
ncbi:hypothetical protein HMPREF0043_01034 [Actinobaculum sp. oral taxon 183 str. F0552]|nr:hypothetical protein HMPREF0043_01034 [Actinobaculum sp. oral taxon 183 str. F0552]